MEDEREQYSLHINDVLQCYNQDQYTITGIPYYGGSSILYPAKKQGSKRKFLIKECFPASSAFMYAREKGNVMPIAEDGETWCKANQQLEYLKQNFVQECLIGQIIANQSSRVLVARQVLSVKKILSNGICYSILNGMFLLMEEKSDSGAFLRDILAECKLPSDGQRPFRTGSLPNIQTSILIIEQLLQALNLVHRQGYLHGDIQDGNLYFSDFRPERGEIGFGCLLDFGCARKLYRVGNTYQTKPITNRIIFSTPEFTAPEIECKNDGTLCLTKAADIYSVGKLFLRLLTGQYSSNNQWRELYEESEKKQLTSKQMADIGCKKEIGVFINQILKRALRMEPNERYADAAQMLQEIQKVREKLEIHINQLGLCASTLGNRQFINREEEYELLVKLYEEGKNPIILCGASGVGKTELAIEFARRLEQSKEIQSYFVPCEHTLRETITGVIAKHFSGYELIDVRGRKKAQSTIYEEVMNLLKKLNQNDILIFDHVQESLQENRTYEELCKLPIHLLLTTSLSYSGTVKVKPMTDRQLKQLMRGFCCNRVNENELEALLIAVNRNALAAELIARVLAHPSYPPITSERIINRMQDGILDFLFESLDMTQNREYQKRMRIKQMRECLFKY